MRGEKRTAVAARAEAQRFAEGRGLIGGVDGVQPGEIVGMETRAASPAVPRSPTAARA